MFTKFIRVNAAQAKLLRAEKTLIENLGPQFVAQDLSLEELIDGYAVCVHAYREASEASSNFEYRNPKLMRNVQTLHQYADVFRKELVRRGEDDPGVLMDYLHQ